MKNALNIILLLVSLLISCEKQKNDPDLTFKIGDNLEYTCEDFELYDSSTHILYFKTYHPEFDDQTTAEWAFYDGKEKIFEGVFWPGFMCSFPTKPFISTMPSFYQNYTLRFQYLFTPNTDLLNDSRLISTFKKCGLLHSGLSVLIDNITISDDQLIFSFTVTNKDKSDLLILDPDKMGPGLFHYFTNGLSIWEPDQGMVYSGIIEHGAPSPGNNWEIDWLSKLKSGESKQFTITYTIENLINSGEYNAIFRFPGLSYHISKEELFQGDSRIWLGDILSAKKITIP